MMTIMETFINQFLLMGNPNSFGIDPNSYSIAITLLTRLLGAIYVIAYVPFLFQVRGLFGKEGILPISHYLIFAKLSFGKKRFYYLPTLFWFNSSDFALFTCIWSGIFLGTLLMLGIYPPIVLLLLYVTHLTLTSAGQDFLSFGWETFLMEVTMGTFLIVSTSPFNLFGWLGLSFLLFRFHVEAGASKLLSGDKNWRNLTAIAYHYLSQPLPNTQAWYFHKLPLWFHKVSTILMLFIEIVVPFAIFSTPEIRLGVFILFVGLQFVIWFTGNLSYLNYITVITCIILIHNQYLEPYISPPPYLAPSPLLWQLFISLLGIVFFALQVMAFCRMLFRITPFNNILYHVQPFHLATPHGIFAVMTTKRYEIVIEGSNDSIEWKEYSFYYKPGALSWRPRRIAPYQPRIDWQAWFLPFSSFNREQWFQHFLIKLLQGSKPVLKLLKYNPFPESPPVFIRVLFYDYEFTTFEEKKLTGNWWKRTLIGEYAHPIRLRHPNE